MKRILEKTLGNLNDEQQKALLSTIKGGHIAVIAVPGSGKTKTIVETAKALIVTKVRAEKILILTFTKKASDEIKERIEKSLEEDGIISSMNVYTFHSFALRMLKVIGINFIKDLREVMIIDETLQKKLYFSIFNKYIERLINLEYFTNDEEEEDTEKIDYLKNKKEEFFSEIKKNKTFSKRLSDYEKENKINTAIVEVDKDESIIYHTWKMYEELKTKNKRIDFDDILITFRDMLLSIPTFRESVKSNFKYIIIDEYQDTSDIQMEIINLIKQENLTIVGDDAQSIYSWRNANVNLITNFEKDYDARLIKMNKNYRSVKEINELANKIIKNNTNQIKKDIVSVRKEVGDVRLEVFENEDTESKYIMEEIKKFENQGTITILYRNHKIIESLEKKFKESGTLYNKRGISDFFNDWYVKIAISYISFILNDNETNLSRILMFKKGVGEKTVTKLRELAKAKNMDMLEAAKEDKKTKEIAEKIEELSKIRETDEMFRYLEENLLTEIKQGDGESGQKEKLKSFRDLITKISKNDIMSITIKTFETIKEKSVNLMTVHSSKGLEFDTVFLLGMEEGNFPSKASVMTGNIEEERRLCLVALTRAKKNLIMTFCRERSGRKYSASSFLSELERKELGLLDSLGAENAKKIAEANSFLLGMMKEKGILDNVK